MTRCLLRLVLLAAVLQGCFLEDKEWTLDRVIPRIETPTSQIAYVGTTWVNDYHRQTTLYDRQGRVLETFAFGRSSYKTLNHYDGAKNILTIHYNCSDSEPSGEMNVDTVRRIFDKTGKLVADKQTFIHFYSRSWQTVGVAFGALLPTMLSVIPSPGEPTAIPNLIITSKRSKRISTGGSTTGWDEQYGIIDCT